MAKIEIANSMLRELLFPGADVSVIGATSHGRNTTVIEIEGADVPDGAGFVLCEITEYRRCVAFRAVDNG